MSTLLQQKQPTESSTMECKCPGTAYRARFDIRETADELTLYGDLPGVRTEDLEIQFENRELTIHGKVAPRQTGHQYLYAEYGVGDFYRTFTIGESIDPSNITAELKDGVLTLHLPKTAAVKPRRIEIRCN